MMVDGRLYLILQLHVPCRRRKCKGGRNVARAQCAVTQYVSCCVLDETRNAVRMQQDTRWKNGKGSTIESNMHRAGLSRHVWWYIPFNHSIPDELNRSSNWACAAASLPPTTCPSTITPAPRPSTTPNCARDRDNARHSASSDSTVTLGRVPTANEDDADSAGMPSVRSADIASVAY